MAGSDAEDFEELGANGIFEKEVFEAANSFGGRDTDMTKQERGSVLRVFLKDLEKVSLLEPEEEKRLGKIIADVQSEILRCVAELPTKRLGKLKHLIREYQSGLAGGGVSPLSRQKLCEEAELKIGKLLSQEIPDEEREEIETAFSRIKKIKAKKEFLDAREKLVLSNLPLVLSIASRMFLKPGRVLADLVQDGSIGLIRAAEKFEYELGFKFSTYASYWIRQKIASGIAKRAGLVHRPLNLMGDIAKIQALKDDPSRDLGLSDVAEIAELAGLSGQEIQKACDSMNFVFQGLDTSPSQKTDGDRAFAEVIPDDKPSPFDSAFAAERRLRLKKIFSLVLNSLEEKVIRMRFGIGSESETVYTYKEIGKALNFSHERVRQIEKKALRKLRNFPILEELQVSK